MESDAGLTPYELRVKRNIEENQRVLRSLGLLNTGFERKDPRPIKKTTRRSSVTIKRPAPNSYQPSDESHATPSLPARRTRRSSSILKSQGYDEFDDVSVPADEENTPPHKRKKLAPEPVFGPIEGVSVGDWWSTRMECSAAGVHRPTVAGIHGKVGEGCYSIALSGGYEDDIDYGEYFTYTGSGGRDLKGTKMNPKNLRTAPQTKDQVLEGPNAALALNIENHRPVRVIRGYKLPSSFAPEEGYRYDGLYSVERCWTATGLSGFKVYKYALKRLLDQDLPPWVTNGAVIPAQNGDSESREDAPSEEKNDSEANSQTQCITADPGNTSAKYLKSLSKHSPNLAKKTENDDEITVTENNTEITLKRKRSSSDLKRESLKTEQKSKSTDFLNSAQIVLQSENETFKPISDQVSSPNMNSEATVKASNDSDSAIDSMNANPNISDNKDRTERETHTTLRRKRSSSDANLHTEGTQQDLISPEDSHNCLRNASKYRDENDMLAQTTPKKTRLPSSQRLESDEFQQEQKLSLDTLNTMQRVAHDKDATKKNTEVVLERYSKPDNSKHDLKGTLPVSKPTDLLNSTKTESGNDDVEQSQMSSKIKSNPKLDPEGTKQIPLSPKDSVTFIQNTSDDSDITNTETQVVLNRNRQVSSPKLVTVGVSKESKSPNDVLNSSKTFSDDCDETGKQTHVPHKRKRSITPNRLPKETKQNPESSSDSMQDVAEDKGGAIKPTHVKLKRNQRSSSPNPTSVTTAQESNDDDCASLGGIDAKNEQSDTTSSADIGRLNDDQEKIENVGVNIVKLNEKSNDGVTSTFCNNSGLSDSATKSPIKICEVQLTPLSRKYLNFESVNLNSSQTEKTENEITEKAHNSSEKIVRFSPEVVINYVKGDKCKTKNIPLSSSDPKHSYRKLKYPIEACVSEDPIETCYSQNNDQTGLQSPSNNSGGDSKKQTSILKYFGAVKKSENKPVSSRGILLRSNRRSVMLGQPVPEVARSQDSNTAPMKRKHSSDKTEIDGLRPLNSTDNSVQKQGYSNPYMSLVKPCSVKLVRLDTNLNSTPKPFTLKTFLLDGDDVVQPFLGWDWNGDEVAFFGFDFEEESYLAFHGFI